MILIISQHIAEHTTDIVVDWLSKLNAQFRRLNGKESIDNLSVSIGDPDCESLKWMNGENNINATQFNVVWFRRWISKDFFYLNAELSNNSFLNRSIIDYQIAEQRILKEFVLTNLEYKVILSDWKAIDVNKLNVLNCARKVGLKIPKSLVTSSKKELKSFSKRYNSIITKSISESFFFSVNEKSFATYTAVLDEGLIEELPESFFPTLFQECIEKRIEIRTFYLEGKFFSMAIFSQDNDKTSTDFRRYDYNRPNRLVPYNLSQETEKSLTFLLDELGLNTASVDLIKSKNGEIFFLEVNPIGQFGMVSEPCNYFLERNVAEWLVIKDKIDDYERGN